MQRSTLRVLSPHRRKGRLRCRAAAARRDWDISSTEQRTAWAKGDKARFYPYGKTQTQVLAEQD
jgi:hypothetical protein